MVQKYFAIAVIKSLIGQQTNQRINLKAGSDFVDWIWKVHWHLIGQTIDIEASSEFFIGKRKWRRRNNKWWRGGLRADSNFISINQRRCHWIRCNSSGSWGGVLNVGCGIGGGRGGSGTLASSLGLMLLVNNMNNTILTQRNRGIFQFLCLPNIVIVEKITRSIRTVFNAV